MNASATCLAANPDRWPDITAAKHLAAIPTMLEIIRRSTGLGFAAVARVTDETWLACWVRGDAGFGLQADAVLPADSMLCREVRRHRRPVVIDDVSSDTAMHDLSNSRDRGFRSYISFPITMPDGEIFGTLCAIGAEPAHLDRPEITGLFQQFSELIGLLLDAQRKPPIVRSRPEETGVASWQRTEPLVALIELLPFGAGLFGSDSQALVANSILQPLLTQGRVPGADADPHWTAYAADGTLLDPRDHPFARASRGESVPVTRFHYRGDDGTERWARISGVPLQGPTDNAASWNGAEPAVLLLVEEERETGEVWKRSEARLRAAIDLGGLSSYRWNPATGALQSDARLKAMWGLTPDTPLDQSVWLSAVHPDDRTRVEAAYARCIDLGGDGTYHVEYRVIGLGDGVERWVSTRGRAEFEDGRPAGFIGVAVEITERKREEAARRAGEARFRRFAEHSTNVLWLADLKSRHLTYLNHALRHVWGVAPERLPSLERWLGTIHPDDRDSVSHTLERVGEGEVVVQEYRILRPSDGAVRRIRDTFFPITGEDGRVHQLGGIAEDVTGRTGARIYLVDEDAPARRAMLRLLQLAGYEVQAFAKAAGLAEVASSLQPGCVILDIETAGPESLAVAKALKAAQLALPVLVIGRSYGDVGFGVRAMKAGAVDYLEKPCEPAVLLTAVSAALAEQRTDTERSHAHDDAKLRIAALSPRERQVLEGLLAGGTNKSIGRVLGLSPRTVEIHRARVMEVLGARTLPEAVLMAARAGVQPTATL